jgi:hypothetical protein
MRVQLGQARKHYAEQSSTNQLPALMIHAPHRFGMFDHNVSPAMAPSSQMMRMAPIPGTPIIRQPWNYY